MDFFIKLKRGLVIINILFMEVSYVIFLIYVIISKLIDNFLVFVVF